MGQNLILNVADHGFTVCAFNRTTSKVDRFLDNEAKGKSSAWNTLLQPYKPTNFPPQASPLSVPTPSRSSAPSSSAPVASCSSSWPASPSMTSSRPSCRFSRRATSSLTVVTHTSPTATAAPSTSPRRASASSAAVFPVVRKVPATVPPSCPVVTRPPGPTSRTSSRASLPRATARPAVTGSVTRVLATMSRWSTTVSSTVTCS